MRLWHIGVVGMGLAGAAGPGCGPSGPTVVRGEVVSGDEGVGGVAVAVGGDTTTTAPDGTFAVEVEGPVAVSTAVVEDGTRAVSDLGCSTTPRLDVTPEAPRPTATLALVLRGVVGEPRAFSLRFHTLEGTEREPVQVDWPAVALSAERTGQTDRWTAQVPVPVASRWALSVTLLQSVRRGALEALEVDQFVALTGNALQAGEVRYVDVLMSDETLRDVVWWDTSGPSGVQQTSFVQTLALSEFEVEVETWRGRADRPVPVPVVKLRDGEPLLGLRSVHRYNGSGSCAAREVGLPVAVEEGTLPPWALGVVTPDTAWVETTVARIDEPFPPPPQLEVQGAARPTLRWGQVPLEAASVSLDLTLPPVRWTGEGAVGCEEPEVAWPEALVERRSAPVQGAFTWRSGASWGRCLLQAP